MPPFVRLVFYVVLYCVRMFLCFNSRLLYVFNGFKCVKCAYVMCAIDIFKRKGKLLTYLLACFLTAHVEYK